MKISDLNETLTLLANLGVIVGIIFLILEISQNTRAIENDAFWSRANASIAVNSVIVENEEVAELMAQYLQDSSVYSEPISGEKVRAQQLFEMIATQSEARFITESDDLSALTESIRRFLNSPGLREAYGSRMQLLTPEFASYIEQLMIETEGNE